ncbi:MAG: hypothetical protein J6S01_04825 [Bacteroidales bacterium]|jgi:hypothetical protein|nr:hypothetical protein [Bacteroidales bacterium]
MSRLSNFIFILILSLCVGSCIHHNDAGRLLDNAEAHLDVHPDSAFVALDSLDRRQLNTPELRARHALLYSIALEKCGISIMNDSIINIAVNYYSNKGDKEAADKALQWREKILESAGNIELTDTLQRQNSRIIQERYADKLELVEKRRQTWAIILAALAVLAFCIAIIRRYAHRLKQKPDDEAMSLIRQRLSVLDKVLASHISSDDKAYRISEEEIENLISDRESFLISTKIVFKENHPGFISILEQKGLSDWEIGYCCLFTLGLKGKEVGEFIQKKRHYIISSEIRKKLGLGEHDTNIGIWLRTLLSETEGR